nr:hypothetical protein Iba_chr12fCG10420 [Ipomoea batatas]
MHWTTVDGLISETSPAETSLAGLVSTGFGNQSAKPVRPDWFPKPVWPDLADWFRETSRPRLPFDSGDRVFRLPERSMSIGCSSNKSEFKTLELLKLSSGGE